MAVPPDLPTLDETVALVHRWLAAASDVKPDAGAERLADLLRDPDGLDFALGFVDRVVRPEDPRVAAKNFERLSRRVPRFLPWYLRALIVLGGGFSLLAPRIVIPIARRALRYMVSHLVIDATPKSLDKSLAELRSTGARLNVNLLGEAVLGDREAARRLQGTRELLARDDVDYVSVKVSAVAAQLNLWGFDETVERVVELLRPLYLDAATSRARPRKFINLDMEEYRDLGLTIAVFTRLLEEPELHGLEAGIVLQAYLPDSVAALQHLTEWAQRRVAAGGAGIKVRIVKGANLAMERVDATMHGWPLATWPTKKQTDTNYKRMLVAALTPEATAAVRVGVAGHNLFDLAFAWLLASYREIDHQIDIEMLLGMAPAQARAVRADTRRLLLYTPVVHPEEFDAAISYLVRRLEENASGENFISGLFDLDDPKVFRREAERFAASLAELDDEVPPANRTQNRLSPPLPRAPQAFRNEPDTDPALVANRMWAEGVLERSRTTRLGLDTIAEARIDDPARLDAVVRAEADAGRTWAGVAAPVRAELLERVGEVLSVFRGRFIEVMAAETGKTLTEADAEVSEAVDFAFFYAERARELGAVRDATFTPATLTLVAPPWNFPVSIPAGGVLAALAAGSAVILKPAPQARRCGAVLAEALWEAGVPRELVRLVDVDEGELGQRLVTAPEIERVVLTGSFETAALFRSWRPDLPLLAETSGKNAIVVTPSADLDLAVKDIVASAFGNAGQKCSAASLAILVGAVADSDRFRRQLADAVTSLAVGWPQDAGTVVGPLIEPAGGKLARGLTRLDEGESWLVAPRQLDETGRLWAPGVRDGVVAGSEFHRTEYFGPVLGLMRAADLDEALALQNGVAYGLTAGIHSLDADEVAVWLDRVQAGNLYVNRPITGAIVRRQPFGGWKRSSVGPGAKAGGPNSLLVLGDWHPVPAAPAGDLRLDGLSPRVRGLVEAFQPALDYAGFDAVRRGAFSDAAAWAAEFAESRDVSQLGVERNVFRYRPTPVTVRLAEGGSLADLVRVLAAAALARAPLAISSATPLRMGRAFGELGWTAVVEHDDAFAGRVAREVPERIRLVGGDARALAAQLAAMPEVTVYAAPVTAAGRIELLPFLREQSVSITAHRFGTPDRAMIALPV
ncbi:bifunctional proline dehydrogenase/L-glutamate gamma-semialdehyde dehydrogenase [Protaetiibacter sp. SSC-01]|uniref:bifunctional proline dehydrogenase/L-glutamate gamma-semialdehyde dehydrogenase n=1 Tax=Protaetiibacter sp. SSC-01 TaxID=2759943 RepID=UPI0016571A79|nr:bifunctional proline dehydrogenase/L-glutamate gamma-semialdehyde dehydrogenase [Protaetiibacter sp. SSC-01]QNO37408.1 bifunctional proline dehydrogenase/L-glutamate gamma-semialdehyde dehydrogenase [Protaetiibacter sp. SSC-01]